jgi:ribonuclease VapC
MIAVDTSAIVAIYAGESDAANLNAAITNDASPAISAGTLLELTIVLRTYSAQSRIIADEWLEQFLASGQFVVHAVSEEQVTIARDAHRRYGKGMGHPAQLNFGDCFSYALAKSLDAPLLYKGADFAKTDVVSAL